jgi:hypothetical protein
VIKSKSAPQAVYDALVSLNYTSIALWKKGKTSKGRILLLFQVCNLQGPADDMIVDSNIGSAIALSYIFSKN